MKIFDVLDDKLFINYLKEAKEYGYQSLVLCVIDSIFSIAAKYESTLKAVERFSHHAGFNMYNDEFTTSEFLENYQSYTYDELAVEIFKNKQRTSATNGILKAEAVVHCIRTLNMLGIETKNDLLECKDKEKVKAEIARIKGQKSGITFEYLLMLAGDINRFKPDRHIYNFFQNYMGYEKLDEITLKEVFIKHYEDVRQKYPRFSIRMFDNLIWNFMKSRLDHSSLVIDENSFKTPEFTKNSEWFLFNENLNFYLLRNCAPQNAINSYIQFYENESLDKLNEIISAIARIDYYLGKKMFKPSTSAIYSIISKKYKQ